METKFPHAVWAAGRSLIALLLPNFDIVDNLWLEPFSWEVLFSVFSLDAVCYDKCDCSYIFIFPLEENARETY